MSIFRYPGGKSKSGPRRWLRAFRPPFVREYREPFVGGGGVFFSLDPGRYPNRWINDRHSGLMAVYTALRDWPDEFIAACRAIPPAREGEPLLPPGPRSNRTYVNARLKDVFTRFAADTTADPALRYFIINRMVWGGRVNYDIPSRLYCSNTDGWDIVSTQRMEAAARAMRGVRITCGDYLELLTEPGDGVWIYCDPPYVVNTELSASSRLYQHSFNMEDHYRFAAAVKACPHAVMVSYDADPKGVVESLYPPSDGFTVIRGYWRYCGSSKAKKELGKELLILNYTPAPQEKGKLVSRPKSQPTAAESDLPGLRAQCEALERAAEAFFRTEQGRQIAAACPFPADAGRAYPATDRVSRILATHAQLTALLNPSDA